MDTVNVPSGEVTEAQKVITWRMWLEEHSTPLLIWVFSRIGLALVAYCGLVLIPVTTQIDFPGPARPDNAWVESWIRWDAYWYQRIAYNGYDNIPNEVLQRDTNFFPLYPLLIRVGMILVNDVFVSGLLVSNLSFLLALLLLYRLIRDLYDVEVARRAIILVAVFPFAYFYSSLYTESTYLLVTVGAFYCGLRGRWAWAGIAAAAAGALRPPGLFILPALGVLYLEHINFRLRAIKPNVLWLALGVMGAAGYFGFLALRFDMLPTDYMRFHNEGWANSFTGQLNAASAVLNSFSSDTVFRGQWGSREPIDFIQLSSFGVSVLLSVYVLIKVRLSFGVWALTATLLSFLGWDSFGRYMAVIFPIFLAAALLLKRDHWFNSVVVFSTMLLALMVILFVNWYWIG